MLGFNFSDFYISIIICTINVKKKTTALLRRGVCCCISSEGNWLDNSH